MERLEEVRERLAGVPDPVALLQHLFAYAPVGFQIFTVDGRSLVTNQAFRDLFGSEPPPEYRIFSDEVARDAGILDHIHAAFRGETVRTPPIWYDPRRLEHVQVTAGRRVACSATFFPLRD